MMIRVWRWAVIVMTCYTAGLTINTAYAGDLSKEFGLVVFGTAVTLAGILLLTLVIPNDR